MTTNKTVTVREFLNGAKAYTVEHVIDGETVITKQNALKASNFGEFNKAVWADYKLACDALNRAVEIRIQENMDEKRGELEFPKTSNKALARLLQTAFNELGNAGVKIETTIGGIIEKVPLKANSAMVNYILLTVANVKSAKADNYEFKTAIKGDSAFRALVELCARCAFNGVALPGTAMSKGSTEAIAKRAAQAEKAIEKAEKDAAAKAEKAAQEVAQVKEANAKIAARIGKAAPVAMETPEPEKQSA
jgi:hypothetical protein